MNGTLITYIKENWVSIAILCCATAVFAYLAYLNNKGKKRKKVGQAEWAGPDIIKNAKKIALKQMAMRKKNSVALYVNQPDGKDSKNTIWIPDVQRGTIVVGAPGSGKTFSFIDPMLRSAIDQGFPICLYDFKYPSQSSSIAGYALAKGYRVSCFCPGFPESQVVNLLDFMRDPLDAAMAKQMAEVLTSNLSDKSKGGGASNDEFFKQAGDQMITGVFQIAKLFQEEGIADVLMCQKVMVAEKFIDRIHNALKEGKINKWIGVSFDQAIGVKSSEKTLASIIGMGQSLFNRFADPTLLGSLCGRSTLDLELTGKKMLIFGMDGKRRDVVKPIIATVMHMVMAHNLHPNRSDPIILALDEFPTITLPSIANWLNECRSYGFCGILGLQTLTQLEKTYGKEMSSIISTGANTKVIFNPGEYDSAKKFSDYLGQEEIINRSVSHSVGKQSSSTYSEQDKTRALLAPESFLTLPSGTCVFINPAYATKSKAYIPAKFKVTINQRDINFSKTSEAQWDKVKTYFILNKIVRSTNWDKIINFIIANPDLVKAILAGDQSREKETQEFWDKAINFITTNPDLVKAILAGDHETVKIQELWDKAINFIIANPDLVKAILAGDRETVNEIRASIEKKAEKTKALYIKVVVDILNQETLFSPPTLTAADIEQRERAFERDFPR